MHCWRSVQYPLNLCGISNAEVMYCALDQQKLNSPLFKPPITRAVDVKFTGVENQAMSVSPIFDERSCGPPAFSPLDNNDLGKTGGCIQLSGEN